MYILSSIDQLYVLKKGRLTLPFFIEGICLLKNDAPIFQLLSSIFYKNEIRLLAVNLDLYR